MQDFWLYFQLGREHIADWQGYDHILFITALCLRYLLKDWKKVVILVTAFTIGHSITLALSVLNYINIPSAWIEFLIPVTIMITALSNVLQPGEEPKKKLPMVYFFALFFGLIHGLGFSNYLKSLLGKSTNIVSELLAFNLGLEAGQLIIVAVVLLISWLCVSIFKIPRREYTVFMSGGVFGI
ncbi:MAG TPA: HupE/UreJ family protein, partial [Chitinophagaceae bacterium]|nr:HupE/UreJ family protein [Chitinophagaceae bacterium]